MARSNKMIETLKKKLRGSGVTYQKLATHLELSESSIKHMFSTGNINLKRMDAICAVIGLELSELASITEAEEPKTDALTLDQEKELIADDKFLLTAYCIVNYWTVEEITTQYAISETECIRYLAKMDKMQLIELQPENRVRLRISNNFNWQPNGPIERYFRGQVQEHFLDATFNQKGDLRLVLNGCLSVNARLQLIKKIKDLSEYFHELSWTDRKLPITEREGTTMISAIRTWQFAAFVEHERT